jgi:porphobilinogen deaminase
VIRIATRGSPLGLLQAEEVAARLRGLGAEVKVVPMRTEGDRRAAARLAAIGGKGLFVRELEQALLAGDAIAERAFLSRLGASCTTPMAGHARLDSACGRGPVLLMTALVISEDGRRVVRASASGGPEHAEAIGRDVAETLLERGAASITPLFQEQPLR